MSICTMPLTTPCMGNATPHPAPARRASAIRDPTFHMVDGKTGTCSKQLGHSVLVPLVVKVINARCHSLASSQTGHQELGLLWETSPPPLCWLPCLATG